MAALAGGSRRVAPVLAAAILLITCGLAILTVERDPWDPDETRYLQITHEMLERGNPFLLTFDGEPYSDKPPLYFWLMAPLVALLGADSAAAGMLPALLSFLLLPWAVSVLARSLDLDVVTGRWGGLLAVTSLLPALLAGGCRMDLTFTLLILLALAALARVATGRDRSSRPFWVLVGLGVLAKGPLALILPLLAALPLLRHRGMRRRLFALPSVLPGLAVVAAWLVPAALLGGGSWFMDAVVHQTAGRAVASFAHREPWWYHLATVPAGLLPWSVVILGALARLAGQRHMLAGAGRLLLSFPVATMLLLSLASGKTLLYPLPLYPVAALAGAWWVLEDPGAATRRLALAAAGCLGLLLAATHAFFLAPHRDMALTGAARWVPALAVAVPSLLAVAAAAAGSGVAALRAAALAVPLFVATSVPVIGPGMNRLLSLKPFGRAYTAAAPGEARGVAYGKLQPGYLLFTGRPFDLLHTPGELAAAARAGRTVAVERKTYRRLPAPVREELRTLATVPYRHSAILIVAARSPSPAGAPRAPHPPLP